MSSLQKVLVVDDGQVERDLLRKLLIKSGFESKELSTGVGIMDVIHDFKPAIVLLDISLPDRSGEDILKEIRAQFSSLMLPVIMVSSTTASSEIVEMLKLGANDYITKPIGFDVTIARMKTHLKIAELSQELSRLKEKDTIQSMIATYNHEINNPLAIAVGSLEILKRQYPDEKRIGNTESALLRIGDIIKKIEDLQSRSQIETESYAGGDIRIIKVK